MTPDAAAPVLRSPRLLRRLLSVALPVLCAATSSACTATPAPGMTASVTDLHLLRHTPFFTALSTPQLRWVIQHSREWEVGAGTAIIDAAHSGNRDDYWILLDGGWTLHLHGQQWRSGHADPGKWLQASQLDGGAFALVADPHSYVMQIAAQDMQAMLDQQFAFAPQLDAGTAFYRGLRQSPVPVAPTP